MIRVLGWTAWTVVSGFAFCVFAWTAGNMPPPETSAAWPFAPWVWTASMTVVALGAFIATGYGVLAACDSALPKGDPRRVVSK
jgi:hypothetical protein